MSADFSNSAELLRAIAGDARALAGLIQTGLSIGSDYFSDATFGLYLKRLLRLLANTNLDSVNSLADFQVLRQLRIRLDAIMKAAEKSDYEPTNEDVSALEYAAKRIDDFLPSEKPNDANPIASGDALLFAGRIAGWIDELEKSTHGGIDDKNGPSLSDPIRSEAERLWRTFPYLLYTVGKPGNFDPARHGELREILFKAHHRAMEYLWFLATKNDVNGLAIREAAHLCQELMRRDFARYYAPRSSQETHWPDCLGNEYDLLPGHQRQVIDNGQNAFGELAAKKAPKSAETTGQPTGDDAGAKPWIDWQALLMMPPLGAAEIAGWLGEPAANVERILRYFRTSHDYGFTKDDDAGFGEAAYRYKMGDVLAHLQKWYAKRQKKAARKSKPADG